MYYIGAVYTLYIILYLRRRVNEVYASLRVKIRSTGFFFFLCEM